MIDKLHHDRCETCYNHYLLNFADPFPGQISACKYKPKGNKAILTEDFERYLKEGCHDWQRKLTESELFVQTMNKHRQVIDIIIGIIEQLCPESKRYVCDVTDCPFYICPTPPVIKNIKCKITAYRELMED